MGSRRPTSSPVESPASVTPIRGPGRPRDARCDQAILRATLDILREGGVAALSIDAVAARAEVGKATIYRRWTSKDVLVLEALRSDGDPIDVPDTGNLRDELETYFDRLIERFAANDGSDVLPHLIEAACYDADVRASLDDYIKQRQKPLRSILLRAAQRGDIAEDVDRVVMAEALVGPVIYRRLLTGGRIDRAFVRKLLDIVIPTTDR
jgi:AcrR family transcriptional regulator